MPVSVVPVERQARGQFNDGAILENKPIGFPHEGGELRPYSCLFYWAHAWTPGAKSLIAEHPHQGFEIMTFVLEGSIEHYDSENRSWRPLSKGDAQIIRAGSGLSHAELLHEASEIFQIWLDPDLRKTLALPPSYDDYRAGSFPVSKTPAMTVKTYHGGGAPMTMTTPGVTIEAIDLEPGDHTLEVGVERAFSAYVLEGRVRIESEDVERKGFAIVRDEERAKIVAHVPSRIFAIASPARLDYPSYAGRRR